MAVKRRARLVVPVALSVGVLGGLGIVLDACSATPPPADAIAIDRPDATGETGSTDTGSEAAGDATPDAPVDVAIDAPIDAAPDTPLG